MIRHHISRDPIERVRPSVPWHEGSGRFKPKGFWYEVDGDWRRWCEAENFGLSPGEGHLYRVELDGERILKIRTLAEFDAFHRRYVTIQANRYDKRPDWRRIHEEGYDGIEIAPYQWRRRLGMETSWYYGWDCASGVIWQPRGMRLVLETIAPTSTFAEEK